MKRLWPLALLVPLFVAGCTSGVPVAVIPEDSVDFGDVPVVTDMSKASLKMFTILNEGTASLRLSDIQVKMLEGCWPPRITVGSTVIKPGEKTSFLFPYAMHPGMGGPHHFEVHMKTNDPKQPLLIFHVRANSVEWPFHGKLQKQEARAE